MALVRVYCGLASADSAAGPASAGPTLTSAVVDDAGRLLHVCKISDDPAGYARLGALLVERSGGPSGAAIAADSDDHMVTSLLSAAGRPLAIADDDSVDDFAERFTDDESLEEMQSPAAERRAIGLARALQAGALSAVTLPAPRDLAGYKPVLAAHAALASGRHSAAVALREVLRELYPAALRAYPDPAETVPLAVLDALPEPGMLGGTTARGQAVSVATEAIAAHLAADGVADADTISAAVTALRVAISETPRRATVNRALTSAVAETVRQAVAAVRACDAGCDALVATLIARVTTPPALPVRRPVRHETPSASPSASGTGVHSTRGTDHDPVPSGGRRSRPEPTPSGSLPTRPRPMAPPPVAPSPVTPPPTAPAPIAPAATLNPPTLPTLPSRPEPALPRLAGPATEDRRPADPATGELRPAARQVDAPTNRPVSAPPPPPPGMTPITPGQRPSPAPGQRPGTPSGQRPNVPPAEAGEPFRATLTTAAINSARAERQRPTVISPRPKTNVEAAPPTGGFSPTDRNVPVPAPRSEVDSPPPGSRANWPLVNPSDDRAETAGAQSPEYTRNDRAGHSGHSVDAPTVASSGEGRVTPPWLADDLPPEPPSLRLVEPAPPADRALRGTDDRDNPPLRLVEREEARTPRPVRSERPAAEHRPPPVSDEGDGDLLIFAAARSAWFSDQPAEDEAPWSFTADTGWRAAEQAASPAVGAQTTAGLPKRVPQANLVPGSPLREERPLRIVRDAASLAENTTGYFRGWRRGQEIGGFAVGGRPGREAAGGWDFSRDPDEREDDREPEYRSAGYRS